MRFPHIIASVILVLAVILLLVAFIENSPVQIEVPVSLTTEKVLDPYSNGSSEDLYYITTDRPNWNSALEEKLDTKYIFKGYSTGIENFSTIRRDKLLELLDEKVEMLYYDEDEWWGVDSSDIYVAILIDRTGQRYFTTVPLYTCGTELVIGIYDGARTCGE